MLSSEEKKWFVALTTKRKNAVSVLEEEGLINVFVSHIVDTYRESAHFIFELLQNADDVKATQVRFVMKNDGILFAHNGSISFTISDPSLERKDGVIPGHINSITTFSLSTKKEDVENKIGKFGIGFKSVFQYTNSPHIYNPPFSFAIRNYMIPEEIKLENGFLLNGETTAFWLPFDKDESAYSEIKKKLEEIKNPLLFLRNVKNVEISISNKSRSFSKEERKKIVELVGQVQVSEVKLNQDTIIKFERKVGITDKEGLSHSLPISMGFVIANGKISADPMYKHYYENAWCYFPTKQETKLNYIINAPFILTPNREALKEGRTENKQIIKALAELCEHAIQGLKHLGYLTEEFYTTIPIPNKLPPDFNLIGEKLVNKLKSGEFIPTKEGDHIAVADSFVCTESLLSDLLSLNDYQSLRQLTGRPKARIVFTERKLFTDQNVFVFFYQTLSGGQQELQSGWLGSKFRKEILETSGEDYHVAFFKYLEARSNVILNKNQPLWAKQFIPVLNDNGTIEFVTPNDKKGDPHVYLGGAKIKGRHIVANYLVSDSTVKSFLSNVLAFHYPDEFDDFFISLSKYESAELEISLEENDLDLASIKRFLNELPTIKKERLLERLKNLKFLLVADQVKGLTLVNPFKEVVYYPDKRLLHYFSKGTEIKQQVRINIDNEEVRASFRELSIEFSPYFFTDSRQLDGLVNFIDNISLNDSVYLTELLRGWELSINFNADLAILNEKEWLFDREGKKKKPNQIPAGFLHSKYSFHFDSIHLRLGAIVEAVNPDRYSGLDDNEKLILETIASANEDLLPEEIKRALDNLIVEKKAKKRKESIPESNLDQTTPEGLLASWTAEPLANAKQKMIDDRHDQATIPSLPRSVDFWKETDEDDGIDNPGGYLSTPTVGEQYKNAKGRIKQIQLEKELELDVKRNQLIEMASQFETYSFGWFKTLLELEDNFVAEDRVKRNPVRVVFRKVELDKDKILILSDAPFVPPTLEDIGEVSIILYSLDEKYTIKGEVISPKKQTLSVKLSNLNQISNLDLTTISYCVVEAMSPDFILERLKTAFANLDFQDSDNLKSKSLMPIDLKFVFGPPGTGKTTYLSWIIGGKNPYPLAFCVEPIDPLMDQNKRVLVLTPTNKAADVICERVLKNYQVNNDYPSWLIRFGQTASLEREPIFVGDRLLKSWIYNQCTLVTTIARFPYDFFKVEKKGKEPDDWKLRDFQWDVIVFDEASMINQAAILYVIYYSRQVNPHVQFFIGGDPFQIPPIIQFEYPYWSYLPEPAFDEEGNQILDETGNQIAWRQDGGNIYSFVGLTKDDSFSNPVTSPHQFPIHNLSKQFRSIVPLGTLFSEYRYNGLLSHDRTEESIVSGKSQAVVEFEIPNLTLKPITVIRFPVKKFGGVYRVRSIKGSPYQVYSAIFSVELIQYIQQHAKTKIGQAYKIGIISPYAIQNTIVTKLIEKIGAGPIEIVTGTVHGFQGDECNLILVILNPPKNITRSPKSFLNKKNILNVAISRAKDKMILMIPFDPDGELNIQDLHQIKYIENLAGRLPGCKPFVIGYEAADLEKAFWGSESFIEENCLSTAHQNVNVYSEIIKKYEIRQDENAIDVIVRIQ